MIHNMVEQGKVSDKAYEQREENREAANRKHQLEMMALIMGNQKKKFSDRQHRLTTRELERVQRPTA